MYKFNWQTESFTHFINNPRDTLSIHGNNIWCMAEEDDEHLWIGTMGEGLGLFNKSGVLVRKYQNNPEDETTLSNSDVFAVLIDSKNNLWVGTRSGLNKYNREKEEFIRYEHNTEDKSSLLGNWVAEIMEDSEGNIWIGTDWDLINTEVRRMTLSISILKMG
jgi:ligand-binding sensor domain-containing protein